MQYGVPSHKRICGPLCCDCGLGHFVELYYFAAQCSTVSATRSSCTSRLACRRDLGRRKVKALKLSKQRKGILESVGVSLPPEVGKRVRHAGDEDTRLGHIRNSRKAMTFITSTWALCVQICGTAFKGLRPFCRPRHRLRLVTVGCFMALGSRWKELWGRTEGPNTREICRSTSGRLEYNRENLRRQLQPWGWRTWKQVQWATVAVHCMVLHTCALYPAVPQASQFVHIRPVAALYCTALLSAACRTVWNCRVRLSPSASCTVLYCTVLY